MPDITKRLLTDATGQDIVEALNGLIDAVDPTGSAAEATSAAQDANTAATAANNAATAAGRVNITSSKSNHVVTIQTTDKSNVKTTTTIREPTASFTSNNGNVSLSITTGDGTQTVTIPDPNREHYSLAHKESVSRAKTRAGNPIQIEDAVNEIADKTVIKLVPKQDLHGFSKPWVAGAGKNKLNLSGFTTTEKNGITFTNNSDGSVKITGTATALAVVGLFQITTAGTYILNGCPSGGGSNSYRLDIRRNTVAIDGANDDGSGSSAVSLQVGDQVHVRVANGYAVPTGGVTFWPMLRLSTETDATWEPFENLCPISGYDTVNVTDHDQDLINHDTIVKNKYIATGGDVATSNKGLCYTDYIPVEPGKTYAFGVKSDTASEVQTRSISGYSSSKSFLRRIYEKATQSGSKTNIQDAVSIPDDVYYIRINYYYALDEAVFCRNGYKVYPIAVSLATNGNQTAGTVYSGTVTLLADGSGQVDVNKAKVTVDNSSAIVKHNTLPVFGFNVGSAISVDMATNEAITSLYERDTAQNINTRANGTFYTFNAAFNGTTGNWITWRDDRFTTAEEMKAGLASNPLEIVAKTSSVATFTLTANQVKTLLGYNYIYTDGAEIALTYRQQSLASNETLLKLLPTGSASGNPVTFSDGADSVPLKQLVVNVEPKQDLNGYEKPWVGGAGKNLLDPTNAAIIDDGVTWTMHDDGTIDAGPSSKSSVLAYRINVTLEPGDYYFNGGIDSTHYVYVFDATTNARAVKWDGTTTGDAQYGTNPAQVKIISGHTYRINSCVGANATGNVVFKPMICKSTETDFTFTPYKNHCPIRGWDSVPLLRTGKNLLSGKYTWKQEIRDDNGNSSVNSASHYTNAIHHIKPGTSYTISGNLVGTGTSTTIGFRVYFLTAEEQWIQRSAVQNSAPYTFTTPNNCESIQIQVATALTLTDAQLEEASSASSFESYKGKTYDISIPSEAGTVYGCQIVLDENGEGELTVDTAIGTITGCSSVGTSSIAGSTGKYANLTGIGAIGVAPLIDNTKATISFDRIGSVSFNDRGAGWYGFVANTTTIGCFVPSDMTAEQVSAILTGTQFVVKIATPVTYSLTAEQVKTLLGTNIISSDAGTVGVTYFSDIGMRIAALEALVRQNT